MTEQSAISELAEQYLAQGYDVKVRPKLEDLPEFARRAGEVGLLATKGRDVVLVHEKENETAPQVVVVSNPGREYVHSLALEAEAVLRQDAPRAAFLVAWAAFEAAARDLLQREGHDADKMPPTELLLHLRQANHLRRDEMDALQRCLGIRNTIIHGVRPESTPSELVAFLVSLSRELLARGPHLVKAVSGSIELTGGPVAVSVVRARLNQNEALKQKAAKASDWVRSVLAATGDTVSSEWDLAEDARGHPVILLSLADHTGKVTTTFDPPELDDESHLRFRINRLWGDLLRVRSHKEVQGVIHLSGGATVDGR